MAVFTFSKSHRGCKAGYILYFVPLTLATEDLRSFLKPSAPESVYPDKRFSCLSRMNCKWSRKKRRCRVKVGMRQHISQPIKHKGRLIVVLLGLLTTYAWIKIIFLIFQSVTLFYLHTIYKQSLLQLICWLFSGFMVSDICFQSQNQSFFSCQSDQFIVCYFFPAPIEMRF